MTVGAVSGTYFYTTDYQTQFFSSSISTGRLNDLMKQYGVLQTGDQNTDLKALFTAMYNYSSQSISAANKASNAQATQPQQAATIEWAPLMQQIGLTATGNLENDYAAFMVQINLLEGAAQTPEAKANLAKIEQQAPSVFVQAQGSTPSAKQVSGVDIMAAMNRAFMLS